MILATKMRALFVIVATGYLLLAFADGYCHNNLFYVSSYYLSSQNFKHNPNSKCLCMCTCIMQEQERRSVQRMILQ